MAEALRIVHDAIDAGINFSTTPGNTTTVKASGGWAARSPISRDAVFLMTKVCTHGRDARVAMRQLDESLRRLRTDHLDLWQIHECVYDNDPDRHFARGGVVEALARAKAEGKVRYVGFTGHKDPDIHLRMLRVEVSVRRLPAAAERIRRPLPELPGSRPAGAGAPPNRRDRDEESRRRRPRGQEERGHGRRRAALRDEPARVHDGVGHRLDESAAAEPDSGPRLQADERARAARLRAGLAGAALDGRFELYKIHRRTRRRRGRAPPARLSRAGRGAQCDGRTLTHVLFDVDGTLIDSNGAHAQAWADALREHSVDVRLRPCAPAHRHGRRQAAADDRRDR